MNYMKQKIKYIVMIFAFAFMSCEKEEIVEMPIEETPTVEYDVQDTVALEEATIPEDRVGCYYPAYKPE